MRIALWVYGLLYLLIEVTGRGLESVGWSRLTPMDVAEAITDAVLVVTVVVAALVALHLGVQRWQRSMADWLAEQESLRPDALASAPITVTSWRPEPLALPPVPVQRYPVPTGPLDGGPPYR